jgi:hypothetical protein
VLTPAAVQHCCIGREFWWLFGRTACFATSNYRQPLPTFPLTRSARATGSCTTGSRARIWYMHDGAPAHFSRCLWDVLRNNYHDRGLGTGGPTAWPPRFTPDLNPLNFYMWRHQNAAPVDNKESLHHFIVDACQTIRNRRDIFERMWRSMMRRVEARIESHGGLSTCYECTLSTLTHKLNVSGHMLRCTFLVCETRAQSLSAHFSYTLYTVFNFDKRGGRE